MGTDTSGSGLGTVTSRMVFICAVIGVLVALVLVGGLSDADSWRDGELFLAPGTIALGVVALVCSIIGFVTNVVARVRKRQGSVGLTVVSASATVLAVGCGLYWLFLAFISASSD